MFVLYHLELYLSKKGKDVFFQVSIFVSFSVTTTGATAAELPAKISVSVLGLSLLGTVLHQCWFTESVGKGFSKKTPF